MLVRNNKGKFTEPARILVAGPRDYTDYNTVARALGVTLSELVDEGYVNFIIVHGDAPGVDSMAKEFVNVTEQSTRLYGLNIKHEAHPAKWHEHVDSCKHPRTGRCLGAGPRRNKKMVSLGAKVFLYFEGPCTRANCKLTYPHPSHGASGCAKLAREAGIEVKTY